MAHKYIGLQQLISLLGGEKKRGSKGEHICLCPAHNDKDPSLSVREGDKGIVMTCVSRGCTTEAICERLGIKMSELFFDPLPGTGQRKSNAGQRSSNANQRRERQANTKSESVKTYDSYEAAYGWLGKLVCTYQYCDSNGVLQYEVARLVNKNGEKDFRQHRPVKPDGSGRCAFPIRMDVPLELRESIIYRQRETEDAVAAGETVFIVEGEKDADTMWGLSLPASTNSGGGGRGRWKAGHTAHFKGAREVFVLPDNDPVGEAHGDEVFNAVAKVAKAVYLVNLKDGYPQLREKGDFTDLVEAVGVDRALEILHQLMDEARENLWQKAQRAYSSLETYSIVDGQTCQVMADGTMRKLCNFVALPVKELTTDDGITVSKTLEIVGWRSTGQPFPPISVPFEKYKSMDWAFDNWGSAANIRPGNAIRENLRYAVQEAGAAVCKYETSYTHFGWQKINGKWCYLHLEGCVGRDNVKAGYNDRLRNYGLNEWPEGMDMVDAAYTSFSLTELIAEYCSVPMLGMTYLAPLCSFLEDRKCECPPSFAAMLCAGHGSGKSTIAALFMCHYGHFHYQGLPANFENTSNAIRSMAYVAKDSLFCIDDYHPSDSPQEKRRINDIAQVLARTFGDHADRARMDKNMKLQKSMPARCLAIATGEQPPNVGQSGLARYYLIQVDETTFPRSEEGDNVLRLAREGALRMAMTGYIEWLIKQADDLPVILREMFEEYKPKAHELIAGQATNDRADAAAAHIMIGLTMMARWMMSLDLMDEAAVNANLEKWWRLVIGNVLAQGRASKTETPTAMFMDAVRSLLDSGELWVDDLSEAKKDYSSKTCIGAVDANNYYLDPPMTYAKVLAFYRSQEISFPLGKDTLWRTLHKEGIIELIDTRQGTVPRQKAYRGKNHRCLWIPRWKIDNTSKPAPSGTQTAMNLDEFTEVHDDELPWQE